MKKISEEALAAMRSSAAGDKKPVRWAVYENSELGHREAGYLRFLAIGAGCTYKEVPPRLPDTATQINWRYLHIGWVDLGTGIIGEK